MFGASELWLLIDPQQIRNYKTAACKIAAPLSIWQIFDFWILKCPNRRQEIKLLVGKFRYKQAFRNSVSLLSLRVTGFFQLYVIAFDPSYHVFFPF
jgi:hypothetical protein